MSHNPIIPPPSQAGIFTMPSKQTLSSDQSSVSTPNIFSNSNQPLRPPYQQPGNGMNSLYSNPNGLPNSPSSTPSPYSSSAVLKTPIPNNVFSNNASPLSSRNSSPAMNQSTPVLQSNSFISQNNPYKPIPQPPAGLSQNRNILPNYSQSGVTGSSTFYSQPSLNASSSTQASISVNQSTPFVPQLKTFSQSQSNIPHPNVTSQANNPMQNSITPIVQPNVSYASFPTEQYPSSKMNQLPLTTLNNANSSPSHVNTNFQPSPSLPNWQINPNAPPLIPSPAPGLQNFHPLVNTSVNSQLGTGSLVSQPQIINSNSQKDPLQNMPYSQGNVYNQSNILSSQTNLSNQPNFPASQPKLPPRLPPPYQNTPQVNFPPNQYPPGLPPNPAQPWSQQPSAQQYNNGQPELSQQMGKMSVIQNSFSQLWGQESVDLLQCRNVLPEEKLQTPPIKLNHQFSQSVNCSPDIFRCTLTKIPESNNLLQKSRLPLGVLIHPFKDLNHLPVIQCSSIVRCRACRTYINPFVYFVDLKRWKCNLCYRVNDLPDEFQYDPVSKTYGEPRRRPEIQSATLEYVAPSEYMLRPPQPAAYTFVLDVSAEGARAGYLPLFCSTLSQHLSELPGDSRTMVAFICYDHAVHYYSMSGSKPTQMTVIDIDDIFVPSPEDLLVNLVEKRTAIEELLDALPGLHANPPPSSTRSALGAALQAAHKLTAPTGGRITVFQTCLTNIGPGGLTAREDPNNRSSKEVAHLNPATDFYKRLALDCSGVQVAVDLFLLNSQYADLSTLSGISQFSGGSIYHFPLFRSDREWQAQELQRCLTRYLTRKIGFEAVMRVRCTRGIAIHTFHGSFFVRSTDLLSLPNVSPDSGFGMQLSIEESLADVQHVCFQAALLYTSSKGERRIRVHTMCLPVSNSLTEIVHSADQQCIIGLLAKMGVDRSLTSSLSDAREALLNAAVDALGAQRITSGPTSGLVAPVTLRLLPLYLLALLKHPAFRTGTSTRLDDRVAAMCTMKSLPLPSLIRSVYPDLYPVHCLSRYLRPASGDTEEMVPCPPRLHLSAEKVNANGAYLLDQDSMMILYVGHRVDPQWLQNSLGVEHHSLIGEGWHSLPTLETEENALLHTFVHQLNDDRPYAAPIQVIVDTGPNRTTFTERLIDDRVESALSYHEFLQHIKSQMK